MPRLAIFAACDNILFDDDLNPTLIGVFCALDIGAPEGAVIPVNAMAPKKWMIFSMWLADDQDLGKTFTQKITIVTPDGTEFGSGSEAFEMVKRSQTMKTSLQGLPIGLEGNLVVRVWLEVQGQKLPGSEHTYSVNIFHTKKPRP